jgi:rhodanese-related sulfurtransferase
MKQISVQEVQQRLENGEALNLIDVREVAEVKAGHIPGMVNIPLRLLEAKLPDLDKHKPYIMVCRSGGRSGQATAFLDSLGYDVTNMIGGMLAWEGNVE